MQETHLRELAHAILNIVFKRRKLLETEISQDSPEHLSLSHAEVERHVDKIFRMVQRGEAIRMVLPAYPGKSPNRNKTLGKLPDMAERHSLDRLNALCEDIKVVYPPGAEIVICSDGYVFSDLVRIPDEDVALYTSEIINYYNTYYPEKFDFFDITDAFPEIKCLDSTREELMVEYGESLISLTRKSQSDRDTQSMYRGITKFMYEDFVGLSDFTGMSNTQIQKAAKRTALRVIQRSNAWGVLLEKRFPDALRLSIHPQFRVSPKIGIKLSECTDCWRTPWHSVAILDNEKVYLEKRSQIDENAYRLIFNQGAPCHYKKEASPERKNQYV